MKERTTKKQQQLLQFIKEFIHEHGYGPSYREIMNGLEYKSVSTVATHVDGLIVKGWLRKQTHSARSLEVVSGWSAVDEPSKQSVVGTAIDTGQHIAAKLDTLLAEEDAPFEDIDALVHTLALLEYSDLYEQYLRKRDQYDKNRV